ncbi:MAG TPA: hypothetical protein VJB65_01675 [Patescibacteria group bacterium]|nr:hypothetical protein [Patescibacteria group bacterium]
MRHQNVIVLMVNARAVKKKNAAVRQKKKVPAAKSLFQNNLNALFHVEHL